MEVKTGELKLRSCCNLSRIQKPTVLRELGESCNFLIGESSTRTNGGVSDSRVSNSLHNQSNCLHSHSVMGRRHKDKLYQQNTWKWKRSGHVFSYSYLFLVSLVWLLYLMSAAVGVEGTDEDWSTMCPVGCKCIWASGRKSVECRDQGFTTLPKLSEEIQALDLSGNRISALTRHMFKDAKLLNLQKLFLRNCSIERVDPETFQDLKIMVELDLSGNKISSIQMETFSSNERLRELYLNSNPLSKLSGTQFPALLHLKILVLRDCQLNQLNRMSFHKLQNLEQLDISGNLFTTLKEDLVEPLNKLIALNLKNNPWKCDCKLKSFRDWAMGRKLIHGTKCADPPRIATFEWTMLLSTDFACAPEIATLQISGQATDALIVGDVGKDITLECLVRADPPAQVHWIRDSLAISDNTISAHGDRRYSVLIIGKNERWVNLTIHKSQPSDAGEYTCVGKNSGGDAEKNLTLNFQDVPSGAGVGIGVGGNNGGFRDQSWLWILLAVIAVLLTLTTTAILVCICTRRRRVKTARSQDLKGGQNQPLVDRRGIEDGDGNKGDGTTPLLAKASASVDGADASDYPDLLNHRPQESPIGSSSSTVPDSTRLIMPQQLNPAALYDPIGNNLTLSYRHPGILHHHGMGRPHSPFSGSVASFTSEPPQVVIPIGNRPGYVTLPRRPRVPSWSPASHSHYPSVSTPLGPPSPTGSSMSAMGPFIGPKYDNLGPRTTADGSSKLSLNKIGLPGSEPSTPLNSATLPMPSGRRSAGLPYHTPTPHFNFAPIQENEPTTPTDSNNHPYGLPIPENDAPLSSRSDTVPRSWKPTQSPVPKKSAIPGNVKSGIRSPTPMSPNSVNGKKVPPAPPPKPNKKGSLSKEVVPEANDSSVKIENVRPSDDGTEV